MTISALESVDNNIAIDYGELSSPLHCVIADEEKSRLFHEVGLVGQYIRQHLVFPLEGLRDEVILKELDRARWISSELFWEVPFEDLRYPRHKSIKEEFIRYDKTVEIQVEDKTINLQLRIIESKNCPKEGVKNHLIVQGNAGTADNNMPYIGSFLDAHLKQQEELGTSIPARFVVFSHYGHKSVCAGKESAYYPGDLEEWGFLFKKVVETIVDNYGSLQLIAAHSLGNIPVIESLKHISNEEFTRLFPQTLLLAQGPSNLYEFSKNIPLEMECYPNGWSVLGIGALAYYLAKWTGWNIELDKTLVERLKSLPESEQIADKLKSSQIVITQMEYDYYFPGKAGLASSDLLEEVNNKVNLYRLTFNPSLAWGIKRGQHNYNMSWLQRQDLTREVLHFSGRETVNLKDPKTILEYNKKHPALMRFGENLVDLVMRLGETVANPQSLNSRVCSKINY